MSSQVLSLVVIVLGSILTIVCVAIPNWSKNDPEDTVRDNIQKHDGLWIQCITRSTGNWDCDDYNRFFLGLELRLQAGRALSVTSIVTALLAMILLIMGIDASPYGGDNKSMKRRLRMIGGGMSLLSSLLIISATSYWANDLRVKHEFVTMQRLTNGTGGGNRLIFGEALFVGWAGGLLTFIGGLVALCGSCGGGGEYDDGPRNYMYRPTKMTPGRAASHNAQEYV